MNNIVLIGMPGCGKTSIGKMLAEKLNMKFVDMDDKIEDKCQKTIPQIFEELGEEYFREIEKEVAKGVSMEDDQVIATGGGVIVNKVNIDNLKRGSKIIFIDRSIEDILKDIDTDSRPLLKDNKERLIELYKKRYGLYIKYCDTRIVNEKDIHKTIIQIIENIK